MKLGIVGTGKIVKEFLSISNRIDNLHIEAICGRPSSEEKTIELAERYRIPTYYSDYKTFLTNKMFDTVYVAVPNHLHYEYAKQALLKNKNVILEKPFTTNYNEGISLFRIANRRSLFIFEAITSLFTKSFKDMKEHLDELGPIRIVEANYSQYSSRYDDFKDGVILPAFDPDKGGGALNDLNIYNLHMAIGLFGMPQSAVYYGNMQHGVDTSGVAILRYPGFICSLIAAKDSFNDSYFNIQGENKVLVQRTSANICGAFEIEDRNMEVQYFDGREYHKHRMINEFVEFDKIMKNNDIITYNYLEAQTTNVLKILDELRDNTIE